MTEARRTKNNIYCTNNDEIYVAVRRIGDGHWNTRYEGLIPYIHSKATWARSSSSKISLIRFVQIRKQWERGVEIRKSPNSWWHLWEQTIQEMKSGRGRRMLGRLSPSINKQIGTPLTMAAMPAFAYKGEKQEMHRQYPFSHQPLSCLLAGGSVISWLCFLARGGFGTYCAKEQ